MPGTNIKLHIDYDHLLDFINLSIGLFNPLKGFMTHDDFYSVVKEMVLKDGSVFTIPIILPIPEKLKSQLKNYDYLKIVYQNKEVGLLRIEDIYQVKPADFYMVFKTSDQKHPGLQKQLQQPKLIVGGEVKLTNNKLIDELNILTPEESKRIFQNKGWETIVGFQTRNAIHRAHEHLQRIGLEICDGLFINPIVGWKKPSDFTERAIDAAYKTMIEYFYPAGRVFYHGLRTSMRYAGPREAIFHAIIRRNLGCTHFIIGRDHAGVGDYYGTYEAHKLARNLKDKHNLGIEVLLLNGPYYCHKCGYIVTTKTCCHTADDIVKISGTNIREFFKNNQIPPDYIMRPEIAQAILKCKNPLIK